MKESGYAGKPVVVLDPSDIPLTHGAALVSRELMTQVGFNVDLQSMDWSTVVARRAKESVEGTKAPLDGAPVLGTSALPPDRRPPSGRFSRPPPIQPFDMKECKLIEPTPNGRRRSASPEARFMVSPP